MDTDIMLKTIKASPRKQRGQTQSISNMTRSVLFANCHMFCWPQSNKHDPYLRLCTQFKSALNYETCGDQLKTVSLELTRKQKQQNKTISVVVAVVDLSSCVDSTTVFHHRMTAECSMTMTKLGERGRVVKLNPKRCWLFCFVLFCCFLVKCRTNT